MKTFEEAFKQIHAIAEEEHFIISGKEFIPDMMSNPLWTLLIINYALRMSELELNEVCSRLHTIFFIGMVTGIEMERNDAKDQSHS